MKVLNSARPRAYTGKVRSRRLRMKSVQFAGVALILLGIASIPLGFVSGQIPPASPPKLLSQYGVVRVYASATLGNRLQITITSREAAPFFVSALTLFLSTPAASNIVLNTINVDGMGAIQVSGVGATSSSQVVVVTSGLTYGDVVQSMPSYLNFLIVKDPLGNNAIVADGGNGGGVVLGVGIQSGGYGGGATISAVATIVAPSDTIVTMTIG